MVINCGDTSDMPITCASDITSASSATNGAKDMAEEVVQEKAITKDVVGRRII